MNSSTWLIVTTVISASLGSFFAASGCSAAEVRTPPIEEVASLDKEVSEAALRHYSELRSRVVKATIGDGGAKVEHLAGRRKR